MECLGNSQPLPGGGNVFVAADCVRHGGAGEEPAEPVANVTLISTPLLITRQKENLGETQARGFEVSGQSRVTDKIVVSGSYWFVNSIVLHFASNPALIGNFLPQVAQETGWGKEEFLSQLCSQKAGLPADCWNDPQIELYVFTADVFDEK